MGVSNLLPALRDITRPVHVSEYRGRAVAVDAYCWLHRGSYSCAREMCEGLPTDGYGQRGRDGVGRRRLDGGASDGALASFGMRRRPPSSRVPRPPHAPSEACHASQPPSEASNIEKPQPLLSPPSSYISFFMDRVRVLQAAGVRPVLVFDGGRLPAKAAEEGTRQR